MNTTNPLSGTNGQLMLLAAHSYSLTTSNWMTSPCIEWLRDNWGSVDAHSRYVIARDTAEALADGRAGDELDASMWRRFLGWIMEQSDQENRERVVRSVLESGRAWPSIIP